PPRGGTVGAVARRPRERVPRRRLPWARRQSPPPPLAPAAASRTGAAAEQQQQRHEPNRHERLRPCGRRRALRQVPHERGRERRARDAAGGPSPPAVRRRRHSERARAARARRALAVPRVLPRGGARIRGRARIQRAHRLVARARAHAHRPIRVWRRRVDVPLHSSGTRSCSRTADVSRSADECL
ncbi:unnamed protein product, partial [Closterium sp. NIES-54]